MNCWGAVAQEVKEPLVDDAEVGAAADKTATSCERLSDSAVAPPAKRKPKKKDLRKQILAKTASVLDL